MNLVRTNLVLAFCWREWRAQRSVLLAYTGMGLAALCLVFLLMPEHWWRDDGRRALALSWFVVIGAIGVIAFVAPALVRGEFGQKGDQFVRRLPGALLPSFGGKLLFLVLATAAMPLLCLLVGEGFLLAIGEPWHDLFAWEHGGGVYFVWPWPIALVAPFALLTPWVWAIGTWLPGGRMALGGTILFVLLLGVAVFAVLRQCPDIEKGIDWLWWLWTVPVLGLAVAAISWTKGRRGGGPLRSARFGLTTAAIGLLPPSLWFGDAAHRYHHPDLQQLTVLRAYGISPDLRFVLAHGSTHDQWARVPFRIELATGEATQLGGINQWFASMAGHGIPAWDGGRQRQYWLSGTDDYHGVFDLATATWTSVPCDEASGRAVLPAALRAAVEEEAFAQTLFRAPGGRRVSHVDGELWTEAADGSRSRRPWPPGRKALVRNVGHGIKVSRSMHESYFDLDGREVPASTGVKWAAAYCVRDRWMFVEKPKSSALGGWNQLEANGDSAVCEPLRAAAVLGLFDDDHLLCCARLATGVPRLFLYRPEDRAVTDLVAPAGVALHVLGVECGLAASASLLSRDPAGRIWLSSSQTSAMRHRTRRHDDTILLLDTSTRAISTCAWRPRGSIRQLLAWPDATSALVCEDATIVRIDVATGERTVLFPRR